MSFTAKFSSIFYCLLSIGLLSLASCKEDQVDAPEVAHEVVDFQFIAFEEELFQLDTNDIDAQLTELTSRYPAFTDLFFEAITPMKDNQGKVVHKELISFIGDHFLRNIKDTINQVIDKKLIKRDFENAFKYAKHYFPNWSTPNIYTLISAFDYQRFMLEDETGDAIGVGLDFFLGSDYPYKSIDPSNPSFSAYLTRTFNKDHIVKKALEIWIDDKLPPSTGNNLVSHMIHNGKKLYILDKLLPHVSDTIIMEYTADQLAWTEQNELKVWSFFFDQDLFYETSMRKLNKYINPSPNSPGMPDQAPGRVANYMGWKIVEAYMKRHPEKSIEMLLLERDGQKILDASKYKPKK